MSPECHEKILISQKRDCCLKLEGFLANCASFETTNGYCENLFHKQKKKYVSGDQIF